ncbi:MAG: Tn3 family transposase [Propionivibrio sp.]|uniref:Tn3 family transposase n=1 Tax=Candidatus Propionivibrio dominans TaxID=2954373 RepID=A0A9D7I712_9RHOO|nr:Tn3 family transposase [Candidatus Propionivibrio dominans]
MGPSNRNSTCIYSQLKRCSSSEVAAMMEGVLRHCTDMEVTQQYVDTRMARAKSRPLQRPGLPICCHASS